MFHLSLSKTGLAEAMNIAMKAIPAKTSLPILECFLLRSENGEITLTANDMEMVIRTKVRYASGDDGSLALDAKLFSEIIRKLPEDEIDLTSEDGIQVTITSGNAKFQIIGKDTREYVDTPSMELGRPIIISQFTLREIINQTIFSLASNESNKMMTGEYFEISENRLRVAALDGHRIAVRNCELTDTYPNQAVIVPGKTLNDISRILTGELDKQVEIFLSRNYIMFRFEDTMVMSRLIEGEYFRINQMISYNYETKVTFKRKEFMDCIDRSLLLVRESDKKPLVLDVKDECVELTMNSVIGNMREQLFPAKEGKDQMIGFNPRFLMDALKVIGDEEVSLYLSNSRAPGFIRDEASTYIYLILPINFVR